MQQNYSFLKHLKELTGHQPLKRLNPDYCSVRAIATFYLDSNAVILNFK